MGRVGRLGRVAPLIRLAFGYHRKFVGRIVPEIEIRSGTGPVRHSLADRMFRPQSEGKPMLTWPSLRGAFQRARNRCRLASH
jgi:hypothetical protein